MSLARTRERRWIVLAEDGRHSTIGRHTDPTEDELERIADGLKAGGQGGWLAVTDGQYYSAGELSVLMVRELAAPRTSWEVALAAFQAARGSAVGLGKRPHPAPNP